MIKTIGIAIAVAVIGVLAFAATKSDTFQVQRSASIKAPPAKIFALIDDFHRWGQWSPYEKLDPNMQRTFSSPASGVGATYDWKSDGKAGAGGMRITEASIPDSGIGKVALDLNFIEPFATHNTVEFTLQPSGDATLVTWTMRGPRPYLAKVMHTIFDMDKMVGGDFETGLADLKTVAEK